MSAPKHRKAVRGPVLFFNPCFFQIQTGGCFQVAAENIRLMIGWDPFPSDSVNGCCCFSAQQSTQNSRSKHPQTAGCQILCQDYLFSQLIFKGTSTNCRLDFCAVFLPALQVTFTACNSYRSGRTSFSRRKTCVQRAYLRRRGSCWELWHPDLSPCHQQIRRQ